MLKEKKLDLIVKRREILFKCTHRGTKELDLLLGSYVKKYINSMNFNDLNDLNTILNFPDSYLFKVLTNKISVDKKMNVKLVNKIIIFNKRINKYV